MQKLNVQNLKDMAPGEIFAVGEDDDKPNGLFLANTGQRLKWLAIRGEGTHDWAIYAHFEYQTNEWIRKHGDKVQMERHIRKCVPCHDEAYALYRH